MQTFDNVQLKLGEDLKETLKPRSKVSIAASVFSIYAFEALQKELSSIEELRFIFTSPTFIEENLVKQSREFYIPHIVREAELCGGEFELRLRNQLNQRAIAQECAEWVKAKVRFKTNRNAVAGSPTSCTSKVQHQSPACTVALENSMRPDWDSHAKRAFRN